MAKTTFDEENTGRVVALGNFDGVHLGHRRIAAAAIDKARELGCRSAILTMEPHPRRVLNPDIPPFRLTSASVKERLLLDLGVDDVITLEFTRELAATSAADFVEDVLAKRCRAVHAVAGCDFVFGRGREGNMGFLAGCGLGVTEVEPLRDETGEVISSSRAREFLRCGDVGQAAKILGRPWSLSGKIARGDARARQMGFPTANIEMGEHLRPRFGVYAIAARRLAGNDFSRRGVANVGVRPTLDGSRELLEFHLFDFEGDIYGEEWEVELRKFIRPEAKFADMEALRRQISADVEVAKDA